MKKLLNNSVYQYALIACLSMVLVLGQSFKLHMHVQHDDGATNSSSAHSSASHIVNVHVSSSLHDTVHASHHPDAFQDHHNYADIDISSDGVLKISKVINAFVFLLLIVSLVLFVPLLQRTHTKHISNTKQTTKYYLLYPPLRAPPI